MLLHFLTLGNGPEPISPFLFYLLLTAASLRNIHPLRPKDTLISLRALFELDPNVAELLRPWMVLKESDPLSAFRNQPPPHSVALVQSVLNQCELQVCYNLSSLCAALNDYHTAECNSIYPYQ